MAHYVDNGFKSFVAAEDLAAYTAVKLDSNGKVVTATAGTDVIIGVVHVAVASGKAADVRLRSGQGTAIITASDVVAIGAAVTATTGGKAVTTTTANNQIIGYAIQAAAADGDLIEIMLSTGKV